MAKYSHSSESLEDIIREENIVDYDSDTVVEAGKNPEPATSAPCESSRVASNTFPERSTAKALTPLRGSTTLDKPIITNRLDEQQQRHLEKNERARRLSQTLAIAEAYSYYRFMPLSFEELLRTFAGKPLNTWPTGREATKSAKRDALKERYLTPEATKIFEY